MPLNLFLSDPEFENKSVVKQEQILKYGIDLVENLQ